MERLIATFVPYYLGTAKQGDKTLSFDAAIAVPMHKYVNAIVEYQFEKNKDYALFLERRGILAGIALKPFDRLTIPIAFATRSPEGLSKTGLVSIYGLAVLNLFQGASKNSIGFLEALFTKSL